MKPERLACSTQLRRYQMLASAAMQNGATGIPE
jgi:hypothetical protein